jgi:hypothetical protein
MAKVIMVVPGTLRSVDLDFDSPNPARGEVVNERTDHGSDATDDPIHDGTHDHGRQANGTRKRHVRMRNKRGSGQRDQVQKTPAIKPRNAYETRPILKTEAGPVRLRTAIREPLTTNAWCYL